MFNIGDFVTLRPDTKNDSYLDLLGKVGKVIDFNFSTGTTSEQFIRVEWSKSQYLDLKAERFEKTKKTS